MIKIEIKNRFTGAVIFEYSKDNNTIKETVENALKASANLRDADLRDANLRDADLSYADLSDANLRDADLSYADLRYADLRYADLRYADLRDANLRGADLSDAKNKETANIPMFCKWAVSIKGDKIQIGCAMRTVKEWDAFFKSNAELSTPRDTEQFNQIHAMYKAARAYKIQLSKFK